MKGLTIVIIALMILGSCKSDETDGLVKTSVEVYNEGINGNTSGDLVSRVDKDVIGHDPGLAIIMIGTNDVSFSVPYNTYVNNLVYLVNKIKAAGAVVLIVSPPPRGTETISDPSYYENDKNDIIASIDDSLAMRMNCYFLDINKLYKAAGTPNTTAASLINNAANNPDMPDGIHPTAAGMLFIAQAVYKLMQDSHIATKYKVVVCFGDSITYGQDDPRAYPAQLKHLLNGQQPAAL